LCFITGVGFRSHSFGAVFGLLVCACMAVPIVIEAHASAAIAHVRTVSDYARRTLADGVARSATLARLIEELGASDVIVFIDTRVDPEIPTAETTFMTQAGGVRYVLVVLNPRMTLDDRVAYLGHELQHAMEIASDAGTMDGASVRRRFTAIGHETAASSARAKSFETDEARRVALMVRRELAGGARTIVSARASAPR